MTKDCRRCGEIKPLGDFSPHRTGVQGRDAFCKACRAELARIRRMDPEVRAAQAKNMRERRQNPTVAQRDRATSADWKRRNPERTRAHNTSPNKVEKNKAWRALNPDKVIESARRYQAKHPEIGKVSQQRRRARMLATESRLTQAEWLDILDAFNHACAYCLRSGVPLQQEHMTPLAKGGTHDSRNVIPSCAPCNYRKHTRNLLQFLSIGGSAA